MAFTSKTISDYTSSVLEEYQRIAGAYMPSPQEYLLFREQAFTEIKGGSTLCAPVTSVSSITASQAVPQPSASFLSIAGRTENKPLTETLRASEETSARPVSGFELLRALKDPYN